MGLFLKKKKNVEIKRKKMYKELLLSVDIDIDSFKHEDLEHKEITIDDEVTGILKKSGKIYDEEDAPFKIVDLATNKEEKIELSLSNDNNEYGIRDIVNRFYKVFGPDDNFNSEFSILDLDEIRKPGIHDIREWDNDVDYEYCITILYSTDSNLSTIFIY